MDPQLRENQNDLQHDLVRRIRLQRGVHDILEDKTKRMLSFQKVINVFTSAFITLVVFADFGLLTKLAPSVSGFPVMLGVATAAFLIFILNTLYDVFSIAEKNATHLRAIQQYTDLLSELKKSKYSSDTNQIEENTLLQFHSRYLQISASSNNAGGHKFDTAQQRYLVKRALRKAREDNPFATTKEIKSRAKALIEACKEEEGEI